MSELLLPPGIQMPEPIQQIDKPDEQVPIEERGRMLPRPQGWKILCGVPEVTDTFENSDIIRPEIGKRAEETATAVLFVLGVGPLAYKDKDKFGEDLVPWCKEGDFILVRTYSGTRFKIYGREFRLLNDDQVDAVVDDPRGITRA